VTDGAYGGRFLDLHSLDGTLNQVLSEFAALLPGEDVSDVFKINRDEDVGAEGVWCRDCMALKILCVARGM
jgi:hypothetical protein